jgi:hypothetical protein
MIFLYDLTMGLSIRRSERLKTSSRPVRSTISKYRKICKVLKHDDVIHKQPKPNILDTPEGQAEKYLMNLVLHDMLELYTPLAKTILCLDDHRCNTGNMFRSRLAIHSPNTNESDFNAIKASGAITKNVDVHKYLRDTNIMFDCIYLDYTKMPKTLLHYINLAIEKVVDGGLLAVTYAYRDNKSVFKLAEFGCKAPIKCDPYYLEYSTIPALTYIRTNTVIMNRMRKLNKSAELLVCRHYNRVFTMIYFVTDKK